MSESYWSCCQFPVAIGSPLDDAAEALCWTIGCPIAGRTAVANRAASRTATIVLVRQFMFIVHRISLYRGFLLSVVQGSSTLVLQFETNTLQMSATLNYYKAKFEEIRVLQIAFGGYPPPLKERAIARLLSMRIYHSS